MTQQILLVFGIRPDFDQGLMTPDQALQGDKRVFMQQPASVPSHDKAPSHHSAPRHLLPAVPSSHAKPFHSPQPRSGN